MRPFQELIMWQKAHAFTLEVYRESVRFPQHERFGLTSQIRRASSSIPTNIAEGSGRDSNAEFHQFLNVALGSATEAEYQLVLARDLGYLPEPRYASLEAELAEVKRILVAFKRRLKEGNEPTPKRAPAKG